MRERGKKRLPARRRAPALSPPARKWPMQSRVIRGRQERFGSGNKPKSRASASRENTTRGIEDFCKGRNGLPTIVAVATSADRYRLIRPATSTRKPRGRSSAASAEGAMLQELWARTGATQGVRQMQREHRCSSTDGEHATNRKDCSLKMLRHISN